MIKQWIDRHLDGEAKESAMVHEIKELRAKLAELEAHTKTLTQAAYAARLERDVAWQRCKELEAQEPKAVNSTHALSFAEAYQANPAAKCKCEHWQYCKECHPTAFAGAES